MTRQTLASLAVAVALFGVLFLPDLLAGRIFAYRDVAYYHLPISRVVGASYRTGQVPFWNPYVACGTPLAANPNNYALYPSRVLDLVMSPEAAIQVHLLALARRGIAMGVLASRLASARPPRPAGVFLLGGPWPRPELANLAPFLAWIPLSALAALRLVRAPGPRSAAMLALCLGIQTTFGEPSLFLVEALFLLAIVLADAAPRASLRAVGTWSVVAAALALLVAAPALVPTLQLAARSARAADPGAELGYSVQPFGLLELVVPQLFGSYHTLEKSTYWGEIFHAGRGPFLLSISLGVSALILGTAGLVARGRRGVPLVVAAVFGLLLAMGGYVPGVRALLFSDVARWLRWPVKLTPARARRGGGGGVGVDAPAGRTTSPQRRAALSPSRSAGFSCCLARASRAFVPEAPANALGPTLLAPLAGLKDVATISHEVAARFVRAGAFALSAAVLAAAAATSVARARAWHRSRRLRSRSSRCSSWRRRSAP
jgi:hypothetical protein